MAQAEAKIVVHTERSIQDALYRACLRKHHRLMVTNVQVFGWESDMVSVTANDFICEYEIKISRSDFRKDLLKSRHARLTNIRKTQLEPINGWWQNEQRLGANYLYYVTPADMIAVDEVPDHAGLMVVLNGYMFPRILRNAPRLHSTKMSERQRAWLERSLTARYWHLRIPREL